VNRGEIYEYTVGSQRARIGRLTPTTLRQVDRALRAYFDLL
jgi:hypothetical protein